MSNHIHVGVRVEHFLLISLLSFPYCQRAEPFLLIQIVKLISINDQFLDGCFSY